MNLTYTCADSMSAVVPNTGRTIYALLLNEQVFYVGDAGAVHEQLNRDVQCALNLECPASAGVKFLRERLKHDSVHFTVEFLESISVLDGEIGSSPTVASKEAQDKYVALFKADDHPVTNSDTPEPPTKEPTPRKVKVSRTTSGEPRNSRGGGWGVNYDDYGKGLTVRTKSPIDGVHWVASHDALVDLINASLLKKGLVPIGPTKKRFGASAGIRPGGVFNPES